MKNHIHYIDKLVADKIKNIQLTPKTQWNKFKNSNPDKFNVEGKNKTLFGNYFQAKNILYTIAGSSIVIVGALFLFGNTDNVIESLKLQNKDVKSEKYASPATADEDSLKDVYVMDEDIDIENSTAIKISNEKDVVIRIEVPIVKNIEITKEVIVSDTIPSKDSVNIK